MTILSREQCDYISLTDMVRHFEGGGVLIEQWLKNILMPSRNTWFRRKSPQPKQRSPIANEADLLNVALFGQTAKQWREKNPALNGNMRDHATIEQLLVLANPESMNAEFIRMSLLQGERLKRLNRIAIRQMQTLTTHPGVPRLPSGTAAQP